MNEVILRNKISEAIKPQLKMALENCACLGREAYGTYIENMVSMLQNEIKKL